MRLTPKQQAFADYYIQTGNATESAIKAGYSKKTSYSIGNENLKKPEVKNYIDEKMKELQSKRIAKGEEVLEYLTRVIRDEETEEIVIVESTGDFSSEARTLDKKIAAKDKIKAAELLGKRYMLFTDKVELSGATKVEIIDDIGGDDD